MRIFNFREKKTFDHDNNSIFILSIEVESTILSIEVVSNMLFGDIFDDPVWASYPLTKLFIQTTWGKKEYDDEVNNNNNNDNDNSHNFHDNDNDNNNNSHNSQTMSQQQQRNPIARTNYTKIEIKALLNILEDVLPIGPDQWNEVVETHSLNYPGRDVVSIRRKYSKLHRIQIPTGDPHCPPEVKQAKRIKYKIGEKAEIGDGVFRTQVATFVTFRIFWSRGRNLVQIQRPQKKKGAP